MPTGQYTRVRKCVFDRLMDSITIDPESSCWLCPLGIDDGGYSRVTSIRPGCNESLSSHRAMYEFFKGPIPKGLELDHLCHHPSKCQGGPTCKHRRCVNPDHLEPVTPKVNTNRGHQGRGTAAAAEIARTKTHCINGHPLTGDNLRICKSKGRTPWRVCVKCARNNTKRMRGQLIHDDHPAPAV